MGERKRFIENRDLLGQKEANARRNPNTDRPSIELPLEFLDKQRLSMVQRNSGRMPRTGTLVATEKSESLGP